MRKNQKSAKNIYKKLYTKEETSKTAIVEPFSKNLTERKCQINNFTIARQTFLLRKLQNL